MFSRAKIVEFIQQKLDVSAIPSELHGHIYPTIFNEMIKQDISTSELLRFILLNPELYQFRNLTNKQLAKFLKCSETLVSKVSNAVIQQNDPTIKIPQGRPTILSQEAEKRISNWIALRIKSLDWPTLNAFKEQVLIELEKELPDFVPGHQYYYDLLNRLSKGNLTVKLASGLASERYQVTPESIQEYFRILSQINIESMDPRLIINIDETGFGASKSGRTKSQKVIVPVTFEGTPFYKLKEEKRHVSCLAATTLAGSLLPPGLVANRKYECEDAKFCSYYRNCLRYFSTSSFVSREIFMHYIRNVIIPYVEQTRLHVQGDQKALIIFDGHKGHFSDLLNAICAEHSIIVLVMPPHSSHLLQPLDQLIFKRMKREFGQFGKIIYLTKNSSTLERIWNAYQASNIIWRSWRSWAHTGIVPVVEEGICVYCQLKINEVLKDNTLQHVFKPNEYSRGKHAEIAEFGILNEDEMLIYEARQCPLCCQPLD